MDNLSDLSNLNTENQSTFLREKTNKEHPSPANNKSQITETPSQTLERKEQLTSAQKKVLVEAEAYGASDWINNYSPDEALCHLQIVSTDKSLSEDPAERQQGDKLSAYVNKLLYVGIKPDPKAMDRMSLGDRYALQQNVNRIQGLQQLRTQDGQQDRQNKEARITEELFLDPSQPTPAKSKTAKANTGKQSSVFDPTQPENSRALESLLGQIQQGLKAREFQGKLPLVIKIGNSTVFSGVPGKKPSTDKITLEQVSLIQKALKNPQGVQGAVRLRVGSETIFHAVDGLLKVDKLGFTQQPSEAQLHRAPQPGSKSNSVKSAQSQSELIQLGQTSSIQPQQAQAQVRLEEQIALLQATIERQQEKLDLITQKLEHFINSPTVIVVGNDQLKNWFSDLNFKIQQAGFQALANSNSQLEQNKATLLSKVKQLWAGAKEAVTDKIHATRNAIQSQASDLALDAVNATAKLASAVGEKLPDGTSVIESRSRNQRLDLSTNGVSLQGRSPIDPVAQWNKFSQGIEDVVKDRPVQYSLAVARNAVRHGMSRTSIEDMLVADPQYQKILTELGHNEAQKYAKQTARSAERREQPSLKAQQERQRSFGNSLQR